MRKQNTNNVSKPWALLQTTEKDEPNIALCEIVTDITRNSERKDT